MDQSDYEEIMTELKTRTIVTKHKTYELPVENEGIPIEEYWPDTKLTDDLIAGLRDGRRRSYRTPAAGG